MAVESETAFRIVMLSELLKLFNPERIAFERGLTLWSRPGGWYTHVTSKSGPIQLDPAAVVGRLRPILLSLPHPENIQLPVLLRPGGGVAPSPRAQELMVSGLERHFHAAAVLEYLSGALVYHIDSLIGRYEVIRDRFKDGTLIPGVNVPGQAVFSSHPEPYYEFDALASAVRRAYDACRYVLWSCYGPFKKPVPRSFSRTIPLCEGLDSALREELLQSWNGYGARVTQYRDCIQHYYPVDFGLSSMFMEEEPAGVWTVSARIPDNPESRSKKQFKFVQRIDALSFGWSAATEVLRVVTLVVNLAMQHDRRQPSSTVLQPTAPSERERRG